MKHILLLPLCASVLLAACFPGEGEYEYVYALDSMGAHADTDHATTARPIAIMTEVMPLVSGKGRIGMIASSGSWTFFSPVVRALDIDMSRPYDSNQVTYHPVEFIANRYCVVRWVLQLHQPQGYAFYASACLDSVFIADSNRYFGIGSYEARSRTHTISGYTRVNVFADLLLPR
ncbi:MAG: hypothetical protein JST22_12435 [Bacteroidetes bacterium]|nr:hypothetical protein [Bacteroidota bacterium]